MSQDLITKLQNVFAPEEPLPPRDARYVHCDVERGSSDFQGALARKIRRTPGHTCHLVSGQRGCGKTTELLRLQDALRTERPGFFVVNCEIDDHLDLADVEYTDVLLAVIQQLWRDASREGVRLDPGRLEGVVGGLKGIQLEAKKLDFQALITRITFEVKKNPDHRRLVRSHLRPRTTGFLESIHEVVEAAEQALRSRGYSGLVVIVDNLDRMLRHPTAETNRDLHRALFIDASDVLRNLSCHVIYTVPPTLLYSPLGTQLAARYGTQPQILPMIPIATRAEQSREEDTKGIDKLVEALDKRVRYVGTSLAKAFDDERTIRRLVTASGGYIRNLMILASSATANVEDLPITFTAVEHAIRQMRNHYARSFPGSDYWSAIRQIASSHRMAGTDTELELLEGFAVFEYIDTTGPWFDVNPLLRELPEIESP